MWLHDCVAQKGVISLGSKQKYVEDGGEENEANPRKRIKADDLRIVKSRHEYDSHGFLDLPSKAQKYHCYEHF